MIFTDILNFFKKFIASDFVKKFLAGTATDDLKKYGTIAVTALQHMKDNLNSPTVKTIEDLLPGDWDLKLVDTIKGVLDKAIPKLAAEVKALQSGTLLDQFKSTVEVISGKPASEKTKIWINLAFEIGAELFTAFVGKPFNLNALFMLIPLIYTQLFGKKTVDLAPIK
jgi:hypothetical protein